jgi:pimeloyl-ACP methyl ester carboxylesterase
MKSLIYKALGARINAVSLVAPKAAAYQAFQLFCTPPKPAIRPKETAFLETGKPILRTTEASQYMLYSWGDASDSKPYVLLAYGWGYNAGRWRHFVPQLVESGLRVIAFDPPGHGLCPGNHVNLHLNSLIIKDIIQTQGKPHGILAHSFGGSSSILALDQLEQNLHPDVFAMMASFSASHPIFVDFSATLGLRTSVLKGMIQHAEGLLKRPLTDLDFAFMTSKLSHIAALIVHDSLDPITPFEHAERYVRNWEGSLLIDANGGGHHLGTQEITDRIIQHILIEKTELVG